MASKSVSTQCLPLLAKTAQVPQEVSCKLRSPTPYLAGLWSDFWGLGFTGQGFAGVVCSVRGILKLRQDLPETKQSQASPKHFLGVGPNIQVCPGG